MGELNILALNGGSSSLKFGFFTVAGNRIEARASGDIESDAGADPLAAVAERLRESAMPSPDAIGHRVVHGGPKRLAHCRIDAQVIADIEDAGALAPLHAPASLAAIRFAQERYPGIAQVACFDTVFHARMPDIARTLPLPLEARAEGVRRYGFHGLSCESIVSQLGSAMAPRLVIAHLGNGASVTAVRDGRSVDTTMGLTPAGGVVMGTRSGDLDPGVLVYLMREHGLDAAALEEMVDRRSGLAGISGLSGDMRKLHAAAASDAHARLAIDMFCYSVAKHVAAMAAALGGIDLLVFTGGIGEHDAQVRERICARLAFMGLEAGGTKVRVMATREEERIARHTADLAKA